MRSINATIVVLTFFSSAGQLQAEAAPAIEILKQAEAASARLTSISYEASGYGEGELSKVLPKVAGKVVAQRGPSDEEHKLAIHGEISPSGVTPARFSFISDGKQAYRIDHRQKFCLSGPIRDARVEEGILIPPHYLNSNPFGQELNAVSTTLEASQKVGDVECDVVNVQYDRNGDRAGRFYFGKKDHLLRRLDRIFGAHSNGTVSKQVVVYVCNLLQPGASVDMTTFMPECPSGYTKKSFVEAMQRVQQPAAPAAPAASSGSALDWNLKTFEGKEVSLKSLRGRVVLLDFWATWCGPCKMAMPGVQKIHDHFKGKPVDIFGANCWERSGPEMAIKYIKDKGYTYPQLLGADTVARQYGVNAIPTLVLLGTDGKILHVSRGFNQSAEQQIISIIDGALQPK